MDTTAKNPANANGPLNAKGQTGAKAPVLAGVIGFYDSPDQLLKATAELRSKNYEVYDAYTPYPVHGMDDAMGIKRSWIPYVTFVAGITGGVCGFALQYWTSAVDWALNVGGKPFNSWPAFIPVTFEATILFAGLATFGAMVFANRLPNTKQRIFDPSITNNRFALFIGQPKGFDAEHEDLEDYNQARSGFKKFNESEAQQVLQSLGAKQVRSVFEEGWF